MRSRVTIAAVILLASFTISLPSGAAPQASKYEAVLGIWDAQTEDGIYTFEFEFIYRNDELVGKYHGFSGTRDMLNLSFGDGLVRFAVDVNGMMLYFAATLAKDNLSGVISLQHGEANIIGVKRKKQKFDTEGERIK